MFSVKNAIVIILVLPFVLCEIQKGEKKSIPIVFVVLSQSNSYHKELANGVKESIVKQSLNLGWEIPRVYLTDEEYPDVVGAWTIFPILNRILGKFQKHHFWLFICEDLTFIDLKKLIVLLERFNATEDHFLGHALKDREATIIHHFAFSEDPLSFSYPEFSAGTILSKSLIKKILERWKKQSSHDFSIDAKHELAKFIWSDEIGISLLNVPELCLSRLSEECVTWITESTPACKYEVSRDNVCFFVKTCEKFHIDRVPVVKNTWGKDANCLAFFSDKTDESIPTINLGIPNVESGHCTKTLSIMEKFFKSKQYLNKNWLVIADDDTLLSIPRLLKLLHCYNSSEAIALGERYGYNVVKGQGYNYITGGGGMVFSREAVKQLRSCKCPSADSPDDMILGICLKKFNIPIIHSKLFHQARPMDYAIDYHHHPPISFHKHWMIDPEQIYQEWLTDNDNYISDKLHEEL